MMLLHKYKNFKAFQFRLILLIMLIILFCLANYVDVDASSSNLIENEGFEEAINKEWQQVQWDTSDSSTLVVQDFSEFKQGKASIKLTNIKENDLRIKQVIKVEPEQVYRFSAYVKTSNIKPGAYGGAISVWETFVGTGSIITNDEWQYKEFYGQTSSKQKEVVLTLGLGGYGNTTTGHVWFDDVKVEAVKNMPSGTIIQNLGETQQVASAIDEKSSKVKKQYIYLYAIMYLIVLLGVYISFTKKTLPIKNYNKASYLIVILGIITLIKIFIAPFTQGFDNDMALFSNWGYRAAQDFMGLYESEGFLDYPPLYMYVLVIIGKINQFYNIQYGSYFYELLLKLPSIMADALTGYLLFKISKKVKYSKIGFIAAILYVINPLVLLDSTIWGQVDSLFVLIILIALYYMWQDRMVFSSIAFVMAVLLKPQGIIFLPILFFELVRLRDGKLFIECVVKSVLAGILVILPFTFKSGILFIIKLYIGTVGGYTYATFNAFNFFGLIGGNYKADNETLFMFTYGIWGLIGIISVTLFVMWLFYKNYSKSTPFLASSILCSGVFLFSARMHERYMFPVLALLLASYLLNKNRKYLAIFVGFTLTNLINVQLVLYHHYYIEDLYINPNSMIIKLIALVNIGLFIWLIQISLKDTIKKDNVSPAVKTFTDKEGVNSYINSTRIQNNSYRENADKYKLKQKDFMIMLVMAMLYLVMTLYQLGNMKSPETDWQIPAVGESFTVEFQEEQELNHISYYTGVANGYDNRGSMNVEALNSNNEFISLGTLEEDGTFIWKVFPLDIKTKQLRFISTLQGGNIYEMGFYNNEGIKIDKYQVIAKTSSSGEIKHLFDEQSKLEIYPNRMNSTYFDEIYFARTAYEMNQGYYLYESTHPTFGKLMILLGIKLFGNNPFGWRIIGALMGVLLIPLMYSFGKRLFGNSLLAFSSAFLMMFDFMHFTHSRFASIDVYTVVCVLLMYYFMYRYYIMDTYKAKRSESLKYLILSALFMTLGISTKWNVVYGVVGLAIIFMASRYYIYYDYKNKGLFRNETVSSKHPFIKKEFIETFMYCVPIFILIPIIIYGLLHIPIIREGNGSGLKQIIKYQIDMYKYHSTNNATHPFSSKWYEWPLMIKPLWLYAYSYSQQGMKSTIASFGNPAIWWPGIIAFFLSGVIVIKEKDKKFAFVFVAYLLQILPWVFVERTTYIYHYFTAIPFNIFMIVYVLGYLLKKNKKNKYIIYGYLALVLLMFLIFYPVLSGTTVSAAYIEKLLLLKSWYF